MGLTQSDSGVRVLKKRASEMGLTENGATQQAGSRGRVSSGPGLSLWCFGE